jgi:hypothetical protein
MSTERTVTIPHNELKETAIELKERGKGSQKHLAWSTACDDWGVEKEDLAITLTEQEICEYSAKALKELANAEEVCQRAQTRADALRKFSQQLYGAAATLQVVKE